MLARTLQKRRSGADLSVYFATAAPKDISAPRRVPSSSALSASLTREISHQEMLNGAGSGALSAQVGPPTANGHGSHSLGHHNGGRALDSVAQKVRQVTPWHGNLSMMSC